MEVIKRTFQEGVIIKQPNSKEVKGYKTTAVQTGEIANSAFISDIMTRYVWKGSRVMRIVDRPNYDGTRTVTAYYAMYGVAKARAVYLVKE